jgi:hypothetical protein
MGTWGVGLFQDDVAADVRGDWREAILDGQDSEEATQTLQASYASAIGDPDESTVFWLALAAAQMETGRLVDEVRDRAVAIIDAGDDLGRWRGGRNEKRREQVLAGLRAKLVGPQSKPKRLRRKPYYGVVFDPGDVVLLRNPSTGDRGLVYVVDRYDEREPHPVVEVLIWDGKEIPGEAELGRLTAVRVPADAGLGLDGKVRPLYFVILTWRRAEAFSPDLGEVIVKNVNREPLADWRRGALSRSSPCYTDYNLNWRRLASGIGQSWRTWFAITLTDLRREDRSGADGPAPRFVYLSRFHLADGRVVEGKMSFDRLLFDGEIVKATRNARGTSRPGGAHLWRITAIEPSASPKVEGTLNLEYEGPLPHGTDAA